MTSHREAPSISKDPVADNTDLYAFVSPDAKHTVTLIANFVPLQDPAGGPNFHSFGDDVQYWIYVDNDGDGIANITYQFEFSTVVTNPGTFLYNTGPISSLTDPNWNVRQFYSVTRYVQDGTTTNTTVLGRHLPCPPVNIGPRSIPDSPGYASLAAAAVNDLGSGIKVFAGQRGEGFYVDLGSIFDLGTLRPFQDAHLIQIPPTDNYPPPNGPNGGVGGTKGYNVHSIAIQVPKVHLTSDGNDPTDPSSSKSVIGVWAAAGRQRNRHGSGVDESGNAEPGHDSGPFTQVSRLGMPLINEVVIPVGQKDFWNLSDPSKDSQFVSNYQKPELQGLLPVLYPGVFPNLAGISAPRADLVAILLTGIPPGLIAGFQNYTGPTQADLLRLNMAIPPNPATSNNNPPANDPARFGLLGGDLAGFPNGRRVFDNVTAVELRAIAGVTYPLVDPSYTPDATAGQLTDGTTNDVLYLSAFPYLALPHQGYLHYHDPNSPNA
ncbi:MAG: DUF4331 domain-containing protein [Nitrososphaerales archaeon]